MALAGGLGRGAALWLPGAVRGLAAVRGAAAGQRGAGGHGTTRWGRQRGVKGARGSFSGRTARGRGRRTASLATAHRWGTLSRADEQAANLRVSWLDRQGIR